MEKLFYFLQSVLQANLTLVIHQDKNALSQHLMIRTEIKHFI